MRTAGIGCQRSGWVWISVAAAVEQFVGVPAHYLKADFSGDCYDL